MQEYVTQYVCHIDNEKQENFCDVWLEKILHISQHLGAYKKELDGQIF